MLKTFDFSNLIFTIYSLKYHRSTTLGNKDTGILKYEFVAIFVCKIRFFFHGQSRVLQIEYVYSYLLQKCIGFLSLLIT